MDFPLVCGMTGNTLDLPLPVITEYREGVVIIFISQDDVVIHIFTLDIGNHTLMAACKGISAGPSPSHTTPGL